MVFVGSDVAVTVRIELPVPPAKPLVQIFLRRQAVIADAVQDSLQVRDRLHCRFHRITLLLITALFVNLTWLPGHRHSTGWALWKYLLHHHRRHPVARV